MLLVLLGVPLFFLALGAHGLSDPDEPYYAVPALEMLRDGSWLVTTLRGQPWFDKPILFYWIVLAAYHLIGVSETAARIGSAFAALGGLFAVRSLGHLIGLDAKASLAAALILATSLEYAFIARAAVTDMTLVLTLTLAMLFGARYFARPSWTSAALFGASVGLAALTKGPVGVILPGVAIGAYALLTRRYEVIRPRTLIAAAAGGAIVAGPWYLYMALEHRDLLLQTFIGEGNVGRFMNPEHPSPFYYNALVLAVGLLPWSGALPLALAGPFRDGSWRGERRWSREERGPGRGGRGAKHDGGVKHDGGEPALPAGPLYALCWFAAPLLVFTLSASKLPTYILPSFPPAALLLARYWSRAFENRSRRGGSLSISATCAILLLAAGAMLSTFHGRDMETLFSPAVWIFGLYLTGCLAAALALWRARPTLFYAAHAGTATLAFLVLVLWAAPGIEPHDSTRPLVRRLASRGLDGRVAGTYHVWDLSLNFYLGRTLDVVTDRTELLRRVGDAPGRIWVVRTRDLTLLAKDPGLISELLEAGPRRSAMRLTLATAGRSEPDDGTVAPGGLLPQNSGA